MVVLVRPVVHENRVGELRDDAPPEPLVREKAVEVEEGRPGDIEERMEGIAEDRVHPLAPGLREAPEGDEEIIGEELHLSLVLGREGLEANRVGRRLEVHSVGDTCLGDEAQNGLGGIPVGVDETDPFPLGDVLADEVHEESRLPRPRRPEDIDMAVADVVGQEERRHQS